MISQSSHRRIRSKPATIITLIAALALQSVAAAVPAQAAVQDSILQAPDLATEGDAQFGRDVAVSRDGKYVITGQHNKSVSGGQCDPAVAVLQYTKSTTGTWSAATKIRPTSQSPCSSFGASLDLSADANTLVVGDDQYAANGTSKAGAVYVFKRGTSGWSQQTRLTLPSIAGAAKLGVSVAVSSDGKRIVAGAQNYSGSASYTGAAVFFDQNTDGSWAPGQIMPGLAAQTFMGTVVDISGNGLTAAVGDGLYYTTSGTTKYYAPSVRVFTRATTTSAWTLQKSLIKPGNTGTSSAGFGYRALSLDDAGTSLLVGCPDLGYVGSSRVAGGAYLYTRGASDWNAPTLFTQPSDTATFKQFGYNVALAPDGNSMVIGDARNNGSGGAGAGAAFLYTKPSGAWTTTPVVLKSARTAAGGGFGEAVNLDAGPSAPVVAAPYHVINGVKNGAVFPFTVS